MEILSKENQNENGIRWSGHGQLYYDLVIYIKGFRIMLHNPATARKRFDVN